MCYVATSKTCNPKKKLRRVDADIADSLEHRRKAAKVINGPEKGQSIAGSGHFASEEQPAAVLKTLRKFMELTV